MTRERGYTKVRIGCLVRKRRRKLQTTGRDVVSPSSLVPAMTIAESDFRNVVSVNEPNANQPQQRLLTLSQIPVLDILVVMCIMVVMCVKVLKCVM